MPTCKSAQLQFTVVIYSLPNGRQSCGLNALAYPIREVLLQTGAVLGLMVVRQSEPCSGKFTIRDRLEVIAGSRVSRSGAAATSKTTGWPPSAGCGPLRLPPTVSPPASTTASGGNRATGMPPPTATFSTSSSASSTAACNTGRLRRSQGILGARLLRGRLTAHPPSPTRNQPRATLRPCVRSGGDGL